MNSTEQTQAVPVWVNNLRDEHEELISDHLALAIVAEAERRLKDRIIAQLTMKRDRYTTEGDPRWGIINSDDFDEWLEKHTE
jgi:hypothetical protein